MNTLANNPIALSDCGQYFSYCTLDGQLKIWDTLSGHLKQEYTPSSHLSATCVTISWPDRHPLAVDDDPEWTPDKYPVSAIRAIDSTNVLIAGNSIKWLDWDKKIILRNFTGHASEVKCLRHVKLADSNDIVGSYFVSSAVGDRLMNAWQLKAETKTRQKLSNNSLASFSLDDEPISVDISPIKTTNPILITVVTRSGLLYIFEHILNGHRKTPINPKVTIRITTSNDSPTKNSMSKQLNILSAQVCNDREILLIYGSLLTPIFERISYEKCEKNTILVRKDTYESIKPSLLVDSGFTKIKSPLKPKNATVVGPAGMAPTRQSIVINNNTNDISVTVDVNNQSETKDNHIKPSKTAKQQPTEERLMSFEDRLRLNSGDPSVSDGHQQPSSDSLTHVLVQGLQSKDKRMLETVFGNTDEKLIRNTIKKLPIDCISLLLYELQSCLFNKSDQTMVYLKWLEQLLHLRLTFLMSVSLPNIEEEFAPLLELMNARTHILDRIYRLKGRLNLMISQVFIQSF
ncbi:unnamed protein product [Medioppia subpectinata]|uniref:Small-subunit processome Utp12 domain-containing protein n=1 Tax=Medioppia subpectinata TaxID=1979941 RepID=A0A7R9KSU0_9ACAR|nr:unnamed protein product [Medioppia subpectinata]CAG2109173.1 unnamed protein product [Medioppia subpectinata]